MSEGATASAPTTRRLATTPGQSRQRRTLAQHDPSGLRALAAAASATSAAAGSPPRKRAPGRRRGRPWPGRGMSPIRSSAAWPLDDERGSSGPVVGHGCFWAKVAARDSAVGADRRHLWDGHRCPARTTASIKALARRLQAPDARLWRIRGQGPCAGETPAPLGSPYST